MFFELLEAVEESDHRCVELRVPQKFEATTAVQRKFSVLIHDLDVAVVAEGYEPVALEGHVEFPSKCGQEQSGLAPCGIDLAPVHGHAGQPSQAERIYRAKLTRVPNVKRCVEDIGPVQPFQL